MRVDVGNITGCVKITRTLDFSTKFIQNSTNTTIKQQDLFKPATIGIDAGFQTLREVVHNLDQGVQGDFIPCFLQRAFQRFNVRVGLLARFFFENRPHGIIERVQIRAVGGPFTSRVAPVGVDCDDIGALVAEEVLCLDCFVCWGSVLLESPFVVPESRVGPRKQMRAQHIHVHVSVDFGALVHKHQRDLASSGDGCPNHHLLGLLDALNDPIFRVRCFFRPYSVVLRVKRLKKTR